MTKWAEVVGGMAAGLAKGVGSRDKKMKMGWIKKWGKRSGERGVSRRTGVGEEK